MREKERCAVARTNLDKPVDKEDVLIIGKRQALVGGFEARRHADLVDDGQEDQTLRPMHTESFSRKRRCQVCRVSWVQRCVVLRGGKENTMISLYPIEE